MKQVARQQMTRLRGGTRGALRAVLAIGAIVGVWAGAGDARAGLPDVMEHAHIARTDAHTARGLMLQPAMSAASGLMLAEAARMELARSAGATVFLAPAIRADIRDGVRIAQWNGGSEPVNPLRTLFSTLFGVQPSPSERERSRTRILITPGAGGDQQSGPQRSQPKEQRPRGGSRAFCVRTCDGRFFPLGAKVNRGSYGVGQAQCQSLCPAAEMELYTSSDDIASAVNTRGRAYAALPTAFLFRRQIVDGCSCNATGTDGGLRHIDIKDDPTLKAGDVVITKDGPRVFAGNRSGPPFQESDFVAPSRFPKLSKEMRQRLKELSMAVR